MIRTASRICDRCSREGARKIGKKHLCDRCRPSKVKPVHDDPLSVEAAKAKGCAIKGMVGKADGKSWLHECMGPLDAHHIKSRGAGGKDAGNLVCLCRRAHDQLHQMGRKSFAAAYAGIDLYAVAE